MPRFMFHYMEINVLNKNINVRSASWHSNISLLKQ